MRPEAPPAGIPSEAPGRWSDAPELGVEFVARIEKAPAMTTASKTPDRLTADERRKLPASAFGIPETHEFPLVDAAHVRAAEAYFRYAPDDRKAALARRILARARELGVDVRSRTVRGWGGEM